MLEKIVAFLVPWRGPPETTYLRARWILLRVIGALYASIFVSLAFQIRGLIGEHGILPVREFLDELALSHGPSRFWDVPSLLWLRADDGALTALVVLGLAASLLLILNVAPRASLAACGVLFLSFVSAAQVFSEYQSDAMILEATAIGVVFAPKGLLPGLGVTSPPSRAATFLLRWEWFRIYFESGLVKLGSGDPTWRDFTAMDHYYENGPLPTWIGWYAQQLPHAFHAATVAVTLFVELVFVWLVFLPRRFRHVCFVVVTALQIGIIATANYAFLNYIVLALGFLLLDDAWFARFARRGKKAARADVAAAAAARTAAQTAAAEDARAEATRAKVTLEGELAASSTGLGRPLRQLRATTWVATTWLATTWLGTAWLAWIFYASIAGLAFEYAPPELSWLGAPARALEPLRVAGRYGLFAVMTPARYEIEIQGSRDGIAFVPYPYRFKPQDLHEPPGIYAPYQPRFEWNLWFASLGSWRDNTWVVRAEACLLRGDEGVLELFRRDPFEGRPPRFVRAVVFQYWMTDLTTHRRDGTYWRRDEIGLYGPMLERRDDGSIMVAKNGGAPAPEDAAPAEERDAPE